VTDSSANYLPSDIDPELWFEMDGCDGRHYLMEEKPTILGHMYAYCPRQQDSTRISKSDILACSDAATYFVRGFLAGSQPSPPLDAEGMLSEDQDAIDSWRASIKAYRETGVWRSGPRQSKP